MLGRFSNTETYLEGGLGKLAQVAAAAGLIVAAVVTNYALGLSEWWTIGFSAASLALTGWPIIYGAVGGLLRGKTNVDELVALAIAASMILGEWISAAIVAFIMVLGSLIEQYTSQRARRHIEALLSSAPEHARRVEADGSVAEVHVADLRPGDVILVRPGDVVAADGAIRQGESTLDESMLTGESVPVAKDAGDPVYAGSVNGAGSLRVVVERVGEESAQGKVIRLVREAEKHKAPILRAADRYAQWFTPTILVLAGLVWLWSGDPLRAVTMLIVGCPCAFVLATPTAVVAALGAASRRGILIKGGKYLEACAAVDLVALDKTGTLTTGRCRVREVVPLDGAPPDDLLAHAARLEMAAEHPLGKAIVREAQSLGLDVPEAADVRREAGLGLSEAAADVPWHIGNERFMRREQVGLSEAALQAAESLHGKGYTVLFVAEGTELRGLVALEDDVRPEASAVLDALREGGYRDLFILTGDSRTAAGRTGEALEFPAERVLAELTPEQKYRRLEAFQREGRRVCYVGDGTNDAPALALADVGVSIGARENTVALETAQMVLMRDGLSSLPYLMRLSKATRRTIYQNLVVFGLVVNAAMLILSAAGLLSPILGAIGHNLGSVCVVLNSARLLRFR